MSSLLNTRKQLQTQLQRDQTEQLHLLLIVVTHYIRTGGKCNNILAKNYVPMTRDLTIRVLITIRIDSVSH